MVSTILILLFIQGGTLTEEFQHPDGIFSLKYPKEWEARVVQGEDGESTYLLQLKPNYDALIIMDYAPSSADEKFENGVLEFQKNFTSAHPEGELIYLPLQKGKAAYHDFREVAQGKTSLIRVFMFLDEPIGIILICAAESESFKKHESTFSEIFKSLNIAAINRSVLELMIGKWTASSYYNAPQTYYDDEGYALSGQFSSSIERSYTFTQDGRFIYSGAVTASDPHTSLYKQNPGEVGRFFAVGNKILLLYDDGTNGILPFPTSGVLQDGDIQFIKE